MSITDYEYIVIRGTGCLANELIHQLDLLEMTSPDFYAILRKKIVSFIDNNEQKYGHDFWGLIVRNNSFVKKLDGKILYVIAILDFSSMLHELLLEFDDNVTFISSDEFIREMHKIVIGGDYILHNDKKKIAISKDILKIEKNEFYYDNLRFLMSQKGISAPEIVKALYFINNRKIPRFICRNKPISEKINEMDKILGFFLVAFNGGGAERVVSNLLPIIKRIGYRELLFTDVSNKFDYQKPEYVEQICFRNAITSDFDQMIDERYEMLMKKQVSIACFHIPYEGHILFYEVLLCYLMGIRVIIENHTCFINALQQRGDITVNLDTYLLANKLIVLSRTDEVFWRSLGVNAQYIPNPCDYNLEDKALKFDTPKEKNALVWVGRINNKYKKVYDLIPIMVNVCKKIPNARLYVVGSATNSKELAGFQKKIADSNLSNNIIICGYQQDVMQYYQKAVAMLMTSPGEGYPMVIIESKANGIPTIMYDLPYLEVVKDGRGIITIEQGNIAEFADKIVEFLENTEMQEIMSNEARESFEQLRLYDFEQAWRNALESDKCEKISDEDVEKEKKLIAKLLKDTDYDYLVSN